MEKKLITSEFMHYESIHELPKKDQKFINQLYEYTKKAYAPFSNYHVGALIVLEDGTTVLGTNQENSSFPAGICAERVAFSAMSALYPEKKPKQLIIVVQNKEFKSEQAAAPCGICRQTITEYEQRFDTDIELLFPAENGGFYRTKSIKSLLPLAFNAKNLA